MPFTLEEKRSSSITFYYFIFSGVLTNTDFQEFKGIFNKCLSEPMGVVFDLRKVSSVPPSMIMDQVNYMREYEQLARKNLIASSIVVESTLLTYLLSCLFKIKKPISPNYITSSRDEGEEFITDHISLHIIENKKRTPPKNEIKLKA